MATVATHKSVWRTDLPQMGLTFEQVWATLMETRVTVNKMAEKVDRVSENIGGVNQSMGELIETLISAKLWEKFDAYPYNFLRAYRRVELFDDTNRKHTDIDILLTNGEYAMAVEAKRHLDAKDDVDHHLKRMELIQQFPPNQCGGKKLLGAMAGGAIDTDVLDYAHSVGLDRRFCASYKTAHRIYSTAMVKAGKQDIRFTAKATKVKPTYHPYLRLIRLCGQNIPAFLPLSDSTHRPALQARGRA